VFLFMVYLLLLLLLLFCQGCDIKGANDPFSYTPKTSHSIWNPPAKAQKRLLYDEMQKDLDDYTEFSREKPLTLAEIIDIALFYNPSTKKSWANARISAAEYGQSLQDTFIQAEVEGSYSRTRYAYVMNNTSSIMYETEYGGQLQLSYLILDFGQTRTTSEAALQSLYNADWSHNSQIQLTIQTLMNDYYNYLYQKELLYSTEQDVLNAKVSLEATEEKFKRGLADVSDIVQAKTSYLQQKLNIVTQKQSLHTAYTQLLNDMGLPSDKPLFFQDYPSKIEPFDLENLDTLILKANHNRPDLLAAEADVKSNELSLKAEKLRNFPTMTGEFDIGRTYYQNGMNDRYDFTAMVSLDYPLFQGFFIENSIKEAKASLEEARASLQQVQLSIIQEVSNYRSDVEYARESLQYARAYLDSAEEDYKVSLAKYKAGTGTIVDLINAQTSVADARSKLASAQNSWYTSVANLAYATGILLPPKPSGSI
jgi:outer membrane protein